LKRWVVALLGALQRSDIEKVQEFADCRIADALQFCYDSESTWGRVASKGGREIMADLGIARINNEADSGSTLTRADLADVVHRKLGLSRAESASLVSAFSITCAIRSPTART
jgi:hypothetical protein